MIQINITIEEIRPGIIALDRKCASSDNPTEGEIKHANTLSDLLTQAFSLIAKELASGPKGWAQEVVLPKEMQGQIDHLIQAYRSGNTQPPQV